jgi:hypothetical protein
MTYTTKDLDALLKSNPDLAVIPDRPRPAIDERNMLLSDYAVQHGGYVAAKELADGASAPIPVLNEHDMQVAVIEECQRRALMNPLYELIFAIPNGGYRHPRVGAMLKAEGLKKGIPDLFCAVGRQGAPGVRAKHGLFLELKISPNQLSPEQSWWVRRLRLEDYVVEVIHDDPAKAIATLQWWIEG